MNGGVCNAIGTCDCPSAFFGPTCEGDIAKQSVGGKVMILVSNFIKNWHGLAGEDAVVVVVVVVIVVVDEVNDDDRYRSV